MQNNSLNNQLLTPHFTLLEFTESRTAKKHGIDNTPSGMAVQNLKRLCLYTLEPLREELGLPVIITSGYRCKELNDKMKSHSKRSQHIEGRAADFYVGSGLTVQGSGFSRRELLIKAFREILTNPKIDFDQLILYPSFIHVSYVSREKNRRGILIGRGDGRLGYGRISLANALKIS